MLRNKDSNFVNMGKSKETLRYVFYITSKLLVYFVKSCIADFHCHAIKIKIEKRDDTKHGCEGD